MTGAAHPQVLAIGETMVVITPEAVEPVETAERFHLGVGGAESNVATHLVREGVPAAWASAVGDDAFGRRILNSLAQGGVDVSRVEVDDRHPTGLYVKDPHADGSSVVYYRSGSAASHLSPAFAERLGADLNTVPLVHLSGITAALSAGCDALLTAIADRRRRAGLAISFDVNHRPALWPAADAAPRLLELARRADLVFVGRDEAERLWDTATATDIRRHIGDGPRLVVKDGAVGAHLFDASGETFVPTPPIEVVEPVGAGDAFAAGFLAGDLSGEGGEAALLRGHRRAAVVLSSTRDS